MQVLDFEKSVAELEAKIEELRHLSGDGGVNIAEEVSTLQAKIDKQLKSLYAKLSPAEKVQVARHSERPQCSDYISALIEDFTPLAGDRCFGDDQAIVGGLGRFYGQSCVVIGQDRGHDTESRLQHNFGMARPEGYRKAQRLMRMAAQFGLPILTLIDTSGAFPGVDAEARGQAEAIARSIETCFSVAVPFVACVIGEGGSGGAIALGGADRILMLEHSIYSVISPEGCASILWRDASKAADAAEALKLTAQDLLKLGVIDRIILEPVGGAHRHSREAIEMVGAAIKQNLSELMKRDPSSLLADRRAKFLAMGRKMAVVKE